MMDSVRRLIEAFDVLSPDEKHRAMTEILKRTIDSTSSSISDDEFTELVDKAFLELERGEATST